MSEGLNKVLLLGNLGADPELKATQGGQAILRLRLATSESYLDRNNVRQTKSEWHTITFWGKRAEGLAKILKKGDRLCVEGKLTTRSWEKDGEKRYSTEVTGLNAYLCGSPRGDGQRAPSGGGGGGQRTAPPTAPPPTSAPPQDDFDYANYGQGPSDDEIPF